MENQHFLISAPGRTEIGGNHTDHIQRGPGEESCPARRIRNEGGVRLR